MWWAVHPETPTRPPHEDPLLPQNSSAPSGEARLKNTEEGDRVWKLEKDKVVDKVWRDPKTAKIEAKKTAQELWRTELVLTFGKCAGQTFRWLLENAVGYTLWLVDQFIQHACGVFNCRGQRKRYCHLRKSEGIAPRRCLPIVPSHASHSHLASWTVCMIALSTFKRWLMLISPYRKESKSHSLGDDSTLLRDTFQNLWLGHFRETCGVGSSMKHPAVKVCTFRLYSGTSL